MLLGDAKEEDDQFLKIIRYCSGGVWLMLLGDAKVDDDQFLKQRS